MGGSASRIWADICALESETTRARMIDTLMQSPEYVREARYAGVYADTMAWISAFHRGQLYAFPYASRGAAAAGGGGGGSTRWSAMYATPIQASSSSAPVPQIRSSVTYQHRPASEESSALIVSPAAKALDYFQEALDLLGISESEELTYERLKSAYKQASLRTHPDKGGSAAAFNEVKRAFTYVGKILQRINPSFSAGEKERMTAPVTAETAAAYRKASAPVIEEAPPISISAKKMDMGVFNRLFEENRLPDPTRDTGYGDWLKSQGGSEDVAQDPRLRGKFNQGNFDAAFRDRVSQQAATQQIVKRLEPDALVSHHGVELGAEAKNFTAGFGSDTQFTDLKEAYTTGATVYQEVAGVAVNERRAARTVGEANRIREREMSRVDPDEKSRIAAAAAALEERERQRRLRLAQEDTNTELWHAQLRRRLLVNGK